jgi:hypothetical protein
MLRPFSDGHFVSCMRAGLCRVCCELSPALFLVDVYRRCKKLISDRQIPLPASIKDGTALFRESYPGADVQVMAELDTRGIIFDGGLVDREPSFTAHHPTSPISKCIFDPTPCLEDNFMLWPRKPTLAQQAFMKFYFFF